ncbi:unnamed protein product [Sphagnum troendelagicum]|uniref:Uncharacterized protein n=1 Tax=Sphagnum troendelagicum TaxID=128251 RepID=A0ABP0UAL3_9BRYO
MEYQSRLAASKTSLAFQPFCSNDHLNGTEDDDLLKVDDIVLQVLQKKPVEATMVVRLEVVDDPSIAWLDLRSCVWGQVEDYGISQLDVVGKLIKGDVATEVIHDEEDLAP